MLPLKVVSPKNVGLDMLLVFVRRTPAGEADLGSILTAYSSMTPRECFWLLKFVAPPLQCAQEVYKGFAMGHDF